MLLGEARQVGFAQVPAFPQSRGYSPGIAMMGTDPWPRTGGVHQPEL